MLSVVIPSKELGVGLPRPDPQRRHQCCQRLRNLPTAGIIDVVSGEPWAPPLPHQPASGAGEAAGVGNGHEGCQIGQIVAAHCCMAPTGPCRSYYLIAGLHPAYLDGWRRRQCLTAVIAGLARFASLQAYYSIAGRDLEREIVPMLRAEEVGLLVWSPLAAGLLSGKYSRERDTIPGGRRAVFAFPPVERERAFACLDAMRPMAEARGASVAQVALAWLLHRRAVSSVIIGARRLDQLEDNLKAVDVELSDADLDALDAASALPREYPGWMFETQGARARLLAQAGRKGMR